MLTQEQIEARKKGIGGSDAPSVLGINPYKTPVDVWMEKTGRAAPDEAGEAAYWGNVLEDAVAREFEKRNGLKVRRVNQTKAHDFLPWLLANIDRDIVGRDSILECKTINAWSGAKMEEPKDEHIIQVQHYMAVLDCSSAFVAYLVGGQKYVQFEVVRDDDLISAIVTREEAFWACVQADVPPKMDMGHPATADLLRKLYPGTNGETITLNAGMSNWHEVLVDCKKREADYAKTAEVARNHILAAMGESAIGRIPGMEGAYTRKLVTRKGYEVAPSSYIDFRFSTKNGDSK